MGKKSKIAANKLQGNEPHNKQFHGAQNTVDYLNNQQFALVNKNQKKRLLKKIAKLGKANYKGSAQQKQSINKILTENKSEKNIEQENQAIQQNQQQFLSISSQGNDNNIDLNLNQKGNFGFQQLLQNEFYNQDKSIKCFKYNKVSQNGERQQRYLYQVKKEKFYKIIAIQQQKLNQTHLNQNVEIKIISENQLTNIKSNKQTKFLVNGKLIQTSVFFMRSIVLKISQILYQLSTIQPQKSILKKPNQAKSTKSFQTKQNILSLLHPISQQEISEIYHFLQQIQWQQQSLLQSRSQLHFIQTNQPFQSLNKKLLQTNNSLMILGKKNTGKSTLAEYIKNIQGQSICVLDCDIGRSLTVSGSVALQTSEQNVSLWIGQFTPFNCIEGYVTAIRELYDLYRRKYFSKKLIINTMGYLSGLGEIVIYQIYNLINPSEIIVLNSQQEISTLNNSVDGNISNILHNIRTGAYLNKLLTVKSSQQATQQIRKFNQKRISLTVEYLKNQHAQGKGLPVRFENILCYNESPKNISELIRKIKRNHLQCINNLSIYEQDKLGKINKQNHQNMQCVNMRIVLLGKQFKQSNPSSQKSIPSPIFRIFGIGFGFQNKVYFSKQQIQTNISPNNNLTQERQDLIGIICEGVDFQKNFYLINEYNLIQLELEYGNIPYLLPVIKGIGSKGTRNIPSKSL